MSSHDLYLCLETQSVTELFDKLSATDLQDLVYVIKSGICDKFFTIADIQDDFDRIIKRTRLRRPFTTNGRRIVLKPATLGHIEGWQLFHNYFKTYQNYCNSVGVFPDTFHTLHSEMDFPGKAPIGKRTPQSVMEWTADLRPVSLDEKDFLQFMRILKRMYENLRKGSDLITGAPIGQRDNLIHRIRCLINKIMRDHHPGELTKVKAISDRRSYIVPNIAPFLILIAASSGVNKTEDLYSTVPVHWTVMFPIFDQVDFSDVSGLEDGILAESLLPVCFDE